MIIKYKEFKESITAQNEFFSRFFRDEINDHIDKQSKELIRKKINKIIWKYAGDEIVNNMEKDINTKSTMYINDINDDTVSIYCYDGEWFYHKEKTNGKSTIIEIDNFNDGCKLLQKELNIKNIQYTI